MDAQTHPPLYPFEAISRRKRSSAQRHQDRADQLNAEADALDEQAAERRRVLEEAAS